MSPWGSWVDWKCKGKHISVCEVAAGEKDEGDVAANQDEEEDKIAPESPEEAKPIVSESDDEKDDAINDNDEVVEKVCKKGWHAFENSCYLIGPVKNNNEAKQFCKRHGATLPTISSMAENKALSALIGKKYVSLIELMLMKLVAIIVIFPYYVCLSFWRQLTVHILMISGEHGLEVH